jgi:hypothetical protein
LGKNGKKPKNDKNWLLNKMRRYKLNPCTKGTEEWGKLPEKYFYEKSV